MSLFLMSLLGGGGRGSKQIKPMSLYILFFLLMASLMQLFLFLGIQENSPRQLVRTQTKADWRSTNCAHGPPSVPKLLCLILVQKYFEPMTRVIIIWAWA